MKTSIFIRTHLGDANWLNYCLTGLRKYANGYAEIVVAVPRDQQNKLLRRVDTKFCRVVPVVPLHKNDYIGQQITKLHADQHCEGDYILHIDSDCVATRAFHVDEFFNVGLPRMTYRHWENAGTAICWHDITAAVVGFKPPHEYMAQLPIIHRAETLANFRDHLLVTHGLDGAAGVVQYLGQLKALSEFNAVGAYAYACEHDQYHWAQAGQSDGYPRPVKQFWSVGGITPPVAEEIAKLLA